MLFTDLTGESITFEVKMAVFKATMGEILYYASQVFDYGFKDLVNKLLISFLLFSIENSSVIFRNQYLSQRRESLNRFYKNLKIKLNIWETHFKLGDILS